MTIRNRNTPFTRPDTPPWSPDRVSVFSNINLPKSVTWPQLSADLWANRLHFGSLCKSDQSLSQRQNFNTSRSIYDQDIPAGKKRITRSRDIITQLNILALYRHFSWYSYRVIMNLSVSVSPIGQLLDPRVPDQKSHPVLPPVSGKHPPKITDPIIFHRRIRRWHNTYRKSSSQPKIQFFWKHPDSSGIHFLQIKNSPLKIVKERILYSFRKSSSYSDRLHSPDVYWCHPRGLAFPWSEVGFLH